MQVITDQTATIPAGNPPMYGQVTVSAHTLNPGGRGNIPAYDIDQTVLRERCACQKYAAVSGRPGRAGIFQP